MKPKPTLLMSARDPNAAHQLAALHSFNANALMFDVRVYACGAASRLLKDYGIPFESGLETTARRSDDPCANPLLDWARYVFEKEKPDAVLAGLSGPEAGIDEALLAVATVKTFAVQDFWGDVNQCLGVPADTYFVSDRLAQRLTEEKGVARAKVTGQPKYARLNNFNAWSACERLRNRLPWPDDVPMVLFAGQPLWSFRAYEAMVREFFEAIASLNLGNALIYRPHPKENAENRSRVAELARACGVGFIPGEPIPTKDLVAAADVVASGFSMVCVDKVFQLRCADGAKGAAMIVLPGEFRTLFTDMTGLEDHPLVALGLVGLGHDSSSIRHVLSQLLRVENQHDYRRRARRILCDPAGSPALILRDVLAQVSNGAQR